MWLCVYPNLTHFLTLSQRCPPILSPLSPEHALSCSEPLCPEDLWMFPSSSCSNAYLTASWGQCFLFSQGVASFSRILSILGSGETSVSFFLALLAHLDHFSSQNCQLLWSICHYTSHYLTFQLFFYIHGSLFLFSSLLLMSFLVKEHPSAQHLASSVQLLITFIFTPI